MRHTKDWKDKIVRHLGMRAAWKVEWLREDLMDNVITKEESAPALAGAFLTLWKGEVVLRWEDTTRRILF